MGTPQLSRRDLFRGRIPGSEPVKLRPPWLAVDRLSECISCGDCMDACPEGILFGDNQGRPALTFAETGCTFCGTCADACPEDLFLATHLPAWGLKVGLSDACLLASGVACQLCTDFCDAQALVFDLSARPVGALALDTDACTGCGMCVGSCPVNALAVLTPVPEAIA